MFRFINPNCPCLYAARSIPWRRGKGVFYPCKLHGLVTDRAFLVHDLMSRLRFQLHYARFSE